MMQELVHQEDDLTARIREAAMRDFKPGERREQLISFIMGTVGDDSTITREEVIEYLEKHEAESGILYDPA